MYSTEGKRGNGSPAGRCARRGVVWIVNSFTQHRPLGGQHRIRSQRLYWRVGSGLVRESC